MYPDYRDQQKANPQPKQHPLAVAPLSSSVAPKYNSDERPERGGCLTLWLVLSFGVGLLGVLMYVNLLGVVAERPGALRIISPVALILFGILILSSLLFLADIWRWKRRGVYGIAITAIASPFIETMLRTADSSDWVAPVIQLGILYFLVKDKWDYFE